VCSFLHSPITPSLFGPSILLNTLFSKLSDIYGLYSMFHLNTLIQSDYVRGNSKHYENIVQNYTHR
jgi:hypothetical protein